MPDSETRVLSLRASRETEGTRKIRSSFQLLNLVQGFSSLSERLFHDKPLRSFFAMAGAALLPKAIETVNATLGINMDSTASNILASQVVPTIAGVFLGDRHRPVSASWENVRQSRAEDQVKELKGNLNPEVLGKVLARYEDTIKLREIRYWLARRPSEEYKDDSRYPLVRIIDEVLDTNASPNESRADRRLRKKRQEKGKIALFMKGQIEGQKLRRKRGYITREVVRKVGDWVVGGMSFGLFAHVLNEVTQDPSTAASVGVIDDIPLILAVYASKITKPILNVLRGERPRNNSINSPQVIIFDSARREKPVISGSNIGSSRAVSFSRSTPTPNRR